MRAVVQRVAWAEVEVDSEVIGRIDRGLLVYLGIGHDDTQVDAAKMAGKIAALRIFEDDAGKMNLSLHDISGGILAVPNFTLLADASKGRRPSFVAAGRPEQAEPLYDFFVRTLVDSGCDVALGQFRAHMDIRSQADGPVNIVVEIPP